MTFLRHILWLAASILAFVGWLTKDERMHGLGWTIAALLSVVLLVLAGWLVRDLYRGFGRRDLSARPRGEPEGFIAEK